MKSIILIHALLVVACLLSGGNAEEEVESNCNLVKGDLSVHYKLCAKITCNHDGSISAVGCGSYQCSPDKPAIGHRKTDPTKPYPECCGGPICPE